ncbi:B12-binding domain-containing radical SAM protein [Candidatus Pacearchaeota archaeon]|nr:B12-binding domain-containing radical SAM protein [Candidatus Pacearchaeota archaeon]
MAKILLVNPLYDQNKREVQPYMPLGLMTLATTIKDKGHEIIIHDREIDMEDVQLLKLLKSFDPDIVGMNSYIGKSLLDLMKIAKLVKENSNAIVIVGGILSTVDPKPFLDYEHIDYVIRGEGELPLIEISELIDKKLLDFSHVKNINFNEIRPFVNLNDYKTPDYSLIKTDKYPIFTFIAGRGCHGKCSFCYNNFFWGKLDRSCLRFYNAKNTISMITDVIDKYNIKEFKILDDDFISLSNRSKEICDALSKYNASFQCQLRTDMVHDEIMRRLKKAGCYSVMFGFESGSQRMLNFLNKGTTVDQSRIAIEQCKKYKIYCDGSYMIGLPTETIHEMKETVNLIKKHPPSTLTAKKYTPFPGTELFDYCVKNKLVDKNPETLEDYSLFEMSSPYPNVSNIPNEVLFETIKELNKKSFKIYMKKITQLIKEGRYKYIINRIKKNIDEKLSGDIRR